MSLDRRFHDRQTCEGKVVLKYAHSSHASAALDLYLRDQSTGGISGTCFDCPAPRVNELYSFEKPEQGADVTARVAWTVTTVQGVHMIGLQFVHGPVAM